MAVEFVAEANGDEKVLAVSVAFQRLAPHLTDPILLGAWARSVSLT